MQREVVRNQGKRIWEGEAPAEPKPDRKSRLGRSLALPLWSNDFALRSQPEVYC